MGEIGNLKFSFSFITGVKLEQIRQKFPQCQIHCFETDASSCDCIVIIANSVCIYRQRIMGQIIWRLLRCQQSESNQNPTVRIFVSGILLHESKPKQSDLGVGINCESGSNWIIK